MSKDESLGFEPQLNPPLEDTPGDVPPQNLALKTSLADAGYDPAHENSDAQPKNKRLAAGVGVLSLLLSAALALPIGIFASIPLSGVGGDNFGRYFFGALFGAAAAVIFTIAFLNLFGHLFKVRKEALAFFTLPPARFLSNRGDTVNISLFISTMAILLAVGVVLNVFSFSLPGFGGRASFVYSFMYLSGILFGPLYGFIVAFFGDFIGHMLAPQGVYSPFIGIGNGLTATIIALVFKLKFSNKTYKEILLVVFTLICMATILSAFYFSEFAAATDTASGRGLHNGARVIIIAAAFTLLVYGVYKIVSIKTHDDRNKERPQWFAKMLLGAILSFIPATLLMGSYAMHLFGIAGVAPNLGFGGWVLARLVSQPVWVGINIFALYMLIPALNKTAFKKHPIE